MNRWRFTVVEPSMTRRAVATVPFGREEHRAIIAQARARTSIGPAHGAKLWGELHRRALAQEGSDDSAWLLSFASRLPCGSCRNHWQEMVDRTPPVWGAYFVWTVARHNEVNARIGKPELDLAAARTLWSLQPTLEAP